MKEVIKMSNNTNGIVGRIYNLKKRSSELWEQNGRVTHEILTIEHEIDQLLLKYDQITNNA